MMHELEKSNSVIVARKPANKAGRPGGGAGGAKGGDRGERGPAKHVPDTGAGKSVSQALDRVRHVAVIGCLSLNTFGPSRMP